MYNYYFPGDELASCGAGWCASINKGLCERCIHSLPELPADYYDNPNAYLPPEDDPISAEFYKLAQAWAARFTPSP